MKNTGKASGFPKRTKTIPECFELQDADSDSNQGRHMMRRPLRPGDLIIYRKTKHSTHPGPRAANIQPAINGDNYAYTIDKFWVVEEVRNDGTIIAATRRGKRNHLKADDPMLKRANFIQHFLYRSRFASLPDMPVNEQQPVGSM